MEGLIIVIRRHRYLLSKVSISNKANRVADLQFDFGIKVEHSLCSGPSCFSDDISTNSNARLREPYDKDYGIKCQVYVRDSQSCTYAMQVSICLVK